MIIVIRSITEKKCKEVSQFITKEAFDKSVIPRTMQQIWKERKTYFVAVNHDKIIGTCGFSILPGRLPEIRSLVITKEFQGNGIGRNLVEVCLQKMKDMGFHSALVLTTTPKLFEKLGFQKADINHFSAKIWKDCRFCPRNAGDPHDPRCNETALFLKL
jgi:amino-acid N-acetyltransferase